MGSGCAQIVTFLRTESWQLWATYRLPIFHILRDITVTYAIIDLKQSLHIKDICKGSMGALQNWLKKTFIFDVLDLANIEAKMFKGPKGWKCLDCEYEHVRKDLMLSHIQANHVDFPGYSCDICGKFSKTWVALNKHRTRNHKNIVNAWSIHVKIKPIEINKLKIEYKIFLEYMHIKKIFSLKVKLKYCSSWMKLSTQNASEMEESILVVNVDIQLNTWPIWKATLKQTTWLKYKLKFLVYIVQMSVQQEVLWGCTWKGSILISQNE